MDFSSTLKLDCYSTVAHVHANSKAPGEVDPDSKGIAFSYARPLFRAPVALVGDGGAAGN